MHLSTDKKQRKAQPIARGFLDYFPNAIAEVAHVSFVGNQQHNPGEELHWSRGKSDDHADCIVRHLIERGTLDDDGLRHSAKAAWRALAALQLEIEKDAAPPATDEYVKPGCRLLSDPSKIKPFQAAARPVDAYGPEAGLPNTRSVYKPDDFKYRFSDRDKQNVFGILRYYGCPAEVAAQITGGLTFAECDGGIHPFVYIAGPMRGFERFNFPAFDAARDALLKKGFNTISPADIDRAACNGDESKIDPSDQTVFVFRDFWSLYFLRKIGGGNGIVLLDGWHKSTGATAEFFLARWLGLKIFSQGGAEITADEAMAAFSFHI